MELRPSRIAVNSVAPGFTDTPMTRSAPVEMFTAWEALEPSGKAASPAEIANAIAFFAAPTTTFITGQTLFVDGGKSLGGFCLVLCTKQIACDGNRAARCRCGRRDLT